MEEKNKLTDKVVNALDANMDGKVDIVDIVILGMKTPGVRIDRASLFRKELSRYYPKEVIEKAIQTTPNEAGISSERIDRIADEIIKFERNCVSGISAALGTPGGWAMAATIPADIIQYYGYTLRAAQKLMYLYGYPSLQEATIDNQIDSQTMNSLILCLGIMNGVAGANNAMKVMAKAFANGVEKKLLQKALTKGTIYPIVKAVMKWFNVKLTKALFAGFFKKAIPVIGGVLGGGITFFSFKPCCIRLQKTLQDTVLSNPKSVLSEEEQTLYEEIISEQNAATSDNESDTL